jgi:hypothetical protein
VTFYGDYVKICEDFALNFGDKITGDVVYYDNAPSHISFFTREFLTENMTVVSHPPCIFSVFPIEAETERPQF